MARDDTRRITFPKTVAKEKFQLSGGAGTREHRILHALDELIEKFPDAPLLMLSEYTSGLMHLGSATRRTRARNRHPHRRSTNRPHGDHNPITGARQPALTTASASGPSLPMASTGQPSMASLH